MFSPLIYSLNHYGMPVNSGIPLFTLQKISAITQGDDSAMEEFNVTFIEETVNQDLTKLKEATSKGDFKEIVQLAHKLKSPTELYEIHSVHDSIREVESLAKRETNIDRIATLVQEIDDVLTEVKNQLLSNTKCSPG